MAGVCFATAVHPHQRGEHTLPSCPDYLSPGSSPPARGTCRNPDLLEPVIRFIPTSAGNILEEFRPVMRVAVHPHQRGEHTTSGIVMIRKSGSSPPARGTSDPHRISVYNLRFIPTSAGNIRIATPHRSIPPVHPHQRGEHVTRMPRPLYMPGSSPPARGTSARLVASLASWRFIPTSAGNIFPLYLSITEPPVHPHQRGEHASCLTLPQQLIGSSPPARGT